MLPTVGRSSCAACYGLLLTFGALSGCSSKPSSSPSGATDQTPQATGTAVAGTQGGSAAANGGTAGASLVPAAGTGAGGSAGTRASAAGVGGGGMAGSSGANGSGGVAPQSTSSDAGTAGTGSSRDAAAAADAGPGSGAALYIAPDGKDTNPGTQSEPLQGLAAAHDRAMPGTTIWVKPGTYMLDKTVSLKNKGTEASPINVFAMDGARPVFDFSGEPRNTSSARGIELAGDYWHLRGLEVINAGDNCIHITGSHNTIEQVVLHGCNDTGLQITADSSQAGDASRAAYNTILNCDSYENYDSQNGGENADGFAAKLYIGPGNVFRGCRAWNNSDDGWDLFASNEVVVIDHCWSIANAKIGPGQNNTNGDGNGFKLGGAPAAGDPNQGGAVHEVTNCVAIGNLACGFTRNNNPDTPHLSMCGGTGDAKGTFCSLSSSGGLTVTMSASEAIMAKRGADGSLPPPH